jgi:hypothetical protein
MPGSGRQRARRLAGAPGHDLLSEARLPTSVVGHDESQDLAGRADDQRAGGQVLQGAGCHLGRTELENCADGSHYSLEAVW